MSIAINISVVRSSSTLNKPTGFVFLSQTENVRAGFTKLCLFGEPSDDENIPIIAEHVKKSLTVHEGNTYLSSEKYKISATKDLIHDYKDSVYQNTNFRIYNHGPCASLITSEKFDKFSEMLPLETDLALAIQCQEWPFIAEEWFTRKRTKGWPSESFIAQVRSMPCFVLPVGDPESTTSDLEWRYAFVPAERELVWTFNDCQIQCYLVLKAIKSQYLKSIAKDDLSSFHLKTIVFWLSEENGIEMWETRNLMLCVVACMNRLLLCIEKQSLPHYFLPERNLMFGKFQDPVVKATLLDKIRDIVKMPMDFVSEWLDKNKDIGNFFLVIDSICPTNLDNENRNIIMQHLTQTTFSFLKVFLLRIVSSWLNVIPTGGNGAQAIKNCMNNIDNLKHEYHKDVIDTCTAFLAGKLLFQILAGNNHIDAAEETYLTELAVTLDGFSGYMYVVTYWLKKGRLENAFSVMQQVYQINMKTVFYSGLLGDGHYLDISTAEYTDIQFSEARVKARTYDIFLESTDLKCLPPAIVYELAHNEGDERFSTTLFHPVFYAQYLCFELAIGTNKPRNRHSAIRNMKCVIENMQRQRMSTFAVHRALNILGFCYRRVGFNQKAFECFVQSLRLVQTKRNCAAYHIAIMLNKRVNSHQIRS